MSLAIQVVAREVPHTSEADLRANLVRLQALLPDLAPGPGAKHADVVRAAAKLHSVAESLLVLRDELPPGVNVSRLAARQLGLLLGEPEELRADLQRATQLLAGCGPAGLRELIQEHPALLRPAAATALLDEVVRLFGLGGAGGVEAGRGRAAALLGSNPGLAAAADCLRSQARGDRDPEYLADTTRASAGKR